MLNLIEIGKKIALRRMQLGMTQEDLARILFVSRQAISSWENGNRAPSLDSLALLSEVLGCGIDDLLCINAVIHFDEKDIFKDKDREYVVNLITSGKFTIPIENIFYQLSPMERLKVLVSLRKRNILISHDLFVKLTDAEQQLVIRGGYRYEG